VLVELAFKFNHANCALDGLLASLVLSTFAKLISTLSNATTSARYHYQQHFEAHLPVTGLSTWFIKYKAAKTSTQTVDLNILYHQFEHQKILLMQLIVMMYQMHYIYQDQLHVV
jgi:hypothetical protein